MKTCPCCAEEIQDAAIKCKHCGEFLDGRPTRPTPATSTALRSGSPGGRWPTSLRGSLLAFGGVALGGVAAGGLAVATFLALGGAAFSLKYAIGGLAVAPHTIGPDGGRSGAARAVEELASLVRELTRQRRA